MGFNELGFLSGTAQKLTVRAYEFGQDSFSFNCSGAFILATLAKKDPARNRMFIWGRWETWKKERWNVERWKDGTMECCGGYEKVKQERLSVQPVPARCNF
jgi:hypothetical protein